MNQQVNLYQPIFRRQKRVFSALALVQVTLVVVLAFAAVYAYGAWRVHVLAADLVEQEARRDAALARLAELDKRLPPLQGSRLLEAEVARLESALEAKRRVAAALDSGAGPGARGFSAHLEGLARQHIQGIWLTGVEIGEAGALLGLKGGALQAELVPEYVQRLAREPVFQGLRFRILRLGRPEADSEGVTFELRTVAAQG